MDVNNNYVWLDKKVYLETNSGRKYVGKVINETDNDILILDIKNHHVQLSKDEIKLIQEEF